MPLGQKQRRGSSGSFFGGRKRPPKRTPARSRPPDPVPEPVRPTPERAITDSAPLPTDTLGALLSADLTLPRLTEQADAVPRLAGVLRHAARRAAPQSTAQAVIALGLTEARLLSVLHLLRLHFSTTITDFNPDPLLARSLRRGAIARLLVRQRDDISEVDAFVLGLMVDIGSLLLSQRLPHLAAAIEALQRHPGRDREEAERLLTGRPHAEELLSSPLSALLSTDQREAIADHHHPRSPLAWLACAADAVADVMLLGESARPHARQVLQQIPGAPALDVLLQEAQDATRQLAGPLRLPLLEAGTPNITLQRDALSGLANHGRFTRQLATSIEQSQRSDEMLSVLLINIDHFHRINEQYGHPAGDRLLRTIAQRINDCTRLTDRLGRLGGDTFCLILPTANATGGQVVAERLRAMVERTELSVGGAQMSCSVSLCGISLSPERSIAASAVLDRLESALKATRNQGRNRVRWVAAG